MRLQFSPLLVILFLFLLTQTACVTEGSYKAPFKKQALLGMEPGPNVFIIKKDGTRISGQKITRSKYSAWRGRQKESWVAVDGNKIAEDDYRILQTETAYTHYFRPPGGGTLFIERLRYGKISLYYYSQQADYAGSGKDVRGDYHVYVFEKGRDVLQYLRFDDFDKALADNPAAQQRFHELFPNGKIPRHREKGNLKDLIEVVELYNK